MTRGLAFAVVAFVLTCAPLACVDRASPARDPGDHTVTIAPVATATPVAPPIVAAATAEPMPRARAAKDTREWPLTGTKWEYENVGASRDDAEIVFLDQGRLTYRIVVGGQTTMADGTWEMQGESLHVDVHQDSLDFSLDGAFDGQHRITGKGMGGSSRDSTWEFVLTRRE